MSLSYEQEPFELGDDLNDTQSFVEKIVLTLSEFHV